MKKKSIEKYFKLFTSFRSAAPHVLVMMALLSVRAGAEDSAGEAACAASALHSGIWANPLWLVLMLASVSFWFFATAWVSDDSLGIGFHQHLWTALFLGIGWALSLLAFFLHPALFILLVFAVAGLGAYYLKLRNLHVPVNFQMFTTFLGTPKAKITKTTSQPDARGGYAGINVRNEKGEPLAAYVEENPECAEASRRFGELVERAWRGNASELRILPGSGGYLADVLKDGSRARLDVLKTETGEKLVSCLISFGRLVGRRGDDPCLKISHSGDESAEVKLKGVKVKGRAGLIFSLPDRTCEIYKKGLEQLGMHPDMVEKLRHYCGTGSSALFITGPPDSGRTTTFYGTVSLVDIFMNDVVTFEEKKVGKLNQVRQLEVDMSSCDKFDEQLSAVLREEPHVLCADSLKVPGITKKMLEFASREGVAIGTLEAENVFKAILRLREEMPADLLAGSLKVITNQRLARRLCYECRESYLPDPKTLSKFKLDPDDNRPWFRSSGCEKCLNTGYDGLTGLYEMLVVNENVRELIRSGGITKKALKKTAGSDDYITIYRDAIAKVQQGNTAFDEIKRVLSR